MSIIKTIPPSSKYIQVDRIFTATFNAPTLNKYDFGIAANTNVVLHEPLTPTSVFFIDRFSFSAQLEEGVYLEAIDVIPTAQLKFRTKDEQIYNRPIPCINFIDNAEAACFFWTRMSAKEQALREALTVTFRGLLNQVPAMAGMLTVRCLLSLQMYEIVDNNFTQLVRAATRPNQQSFQVF